MTVETSEKTRYGLRISPSKRHSHENRPLFDERGYCHGAVASVTFQEPRVDDKGKTYGASYKWEIACPGTIETFVRIHWTWTRLRAPKPSEKRSAFADLCLRLGLTHEAQLSLGDAEIDASYAVGLAISYALMRKDGDYQIDGASISLEKNAGAQLTLWG